MNRFMTVAAGFALVGVAFGQGPKAEEFDAKNDPPAIVQWARGHAPDFAAKAVGGKPVTLLLNHGGPILTSTYVETIFWGTSWGNTAFVGDKITGLDTFYSTVGGSNYMKTNNEYTGPNGTVGTTVSFGGHTIDTSAAPTSAPSTGTILGKVCTATGNHPHADAFYAVYIDNKRGNAGYCAWHSSSSCPGDPTPVQFGFFFNLDGDSGCNPDAAVNHSQGLAALMNVSGHELSETVTDPQLNAWYDRQGAENADKCAWTFSTGSGVNNVSFGGTTWKIQGNFSNAAAGTKSGYDHGGCIDNKP